MRERKNRFAIDASLCLLHDIQPAKSSKNVFSSLFLDVKETFNHVSTDRLVAILHKLKMLNQLIRWVKFFMIDRKIELAFDEKKQAARSIHTEISQKLSISSILFTIYIRFLFSEIKNEAKYANIRMLSFIDDVAIEIESKSAEQNCKVLNKIVQKVFQWADRNAVKFDGKKSELIHFESSNTSSIDTVKLSNTTILKSKLNVRTLNIFIDRKLSFKNHAQNRIASANRVLHSINRFQNSDWNLKSNARRQIYQTCISSISDYNAEIWYNAQNSQKSYIDQLKKLQNSTLREVLEFFRITSIDAMKIELNILSIEIHMYRDMQKYALRTMKMTENYSVCICISIFYFSEYQNETFDKNFIQWDENEKKHASQINRILNIMTSHVSQCHAHWNMEVLLAMKQQACRWVFLVLRLRYGRATTVTV